MSAIHDLAATIAARKTADPDSSWTAKLLAKEGVALASASTKPVGGQAQTQTPIATPTAPLSVVSTAPKKPLKNDNKTRQMVKELAEKETLLAQLQAEVAGLEAQLGGNLPLDQINALSVKLQGVLANLQSTEERWLELSELLEAA